METIFKKFDVIGTTKDEAIANAAPMNLMVNATQAYTKWAENNTETEENIKEWMKEYLRKKNYDGKANVGAYIVLQSAQVDTRERPYEIKAPKYEVKTHTGEHFYVLRDATGNVVGKEKTKEAAKNAMKEYITENREDVFAFHEWITKENNALALVGKYTPSKGSRPCKIRCFGYVNVD